MLGAKFCLRLVELIQSRIEHKQKKNMHNSTYHKNYQDHLNEEVGCLGTER